MNMAIVMESMMAFGFICRKQVSFYRFAVTVRVSRISVGTRVRFRFSDGVGTGLPNME